MDSNIIIVDDDMDFLQSLQRGLTISGFKNVKIYKDPFKAAQLIETKKDVDIALIDVTMPGMRGVELLEHIKKSLLHHQKRKQI